MPPKNTKKRSTKVPPSVKQYVKKQMRTNSELKRLALTDQEKSEGTSATSFFTNDLSPISSGTNSFQREGAEVRLQGVQVKGIFTSSSTVPIYVRYVIGYFLGNQGETLSVNTYLFKGASGQMQTAGQVYGVGSAQFTLLSAPFYEDMFHPIYDKIHKIGPTGSTEGNNTKLINKFIKLHNKKVTFPGLPQADVSLPRLVVIRMYSDANQDYIGVQPIEYSGLSTVWFRDI